MKKSEQIKINEQVLGVYKEVYNTIRYADEIEWKRLRTCQARVALIGKFSVLQSYDTVIAVIDNTTDTLYDFLRYVYGYTSTSAQHIAKFNHDYCNGSWGCDNRLTYREV